MGKTTADDVRDKLGQPTMENHTDPFHKGQYVWVYAAQDHSMVYTFLFDKDDLVVRMMVYKNTAAQ